MPLATSFLIASGTTCLSSLYVNPNHILFVSSSFTFAVPVFISPSMIVGSRYSGFISPGSREYKNSTNLPSRISMKSGVSSHMFMETYHFIVFFIALENINLPFLSFPKSHTKAAEYSQIY